MKAGRGLQIRSLDPFSGPTQGLPNYFEKEDLHGIIMESREWLDREKNIMDKNLQGLPCHF